jgi:hypothetical protein
MPLPVAGAEEEGLLEGWKAIGELLHLKGSPRSIQRRLRGWEQAEGLPVIRRRGRIFGRPSALRAWDLEGPRGTPRGNK